MSTKPTDIGRFAVDGADVDAVNISAPSSGLRDTGFPNNYVPPAGEFNYLENLGYRWRKYLSDGALQGLITMSNDLVVAGNVTTGGTYRHPTVVLTVPGAMGFPASGGAAVTYVGHSIRGGGAGTAFSTQHPILLPTGKRITSFRVRLKDSATGPTIMRCALTRSAIDGTDTESTVASQVSSGSGANQWVGVTGLTETIVDEAGYAIAVTCDSGTGACIVFKIRIEYDQVV